MPEELQSPVSAEFRGDEFQVRERLEEQLAVRVAAAPLATFEFGAEGLDLALRIFDISPVSVVGFVSFRLESLPGTIPSC